MGNAESSPRSSFHGDTSEDSSSLLSFPGSTLVESALTCGKLFDESSNNGNGRKKKTLAAQILQHAEHCVMSPQNSELGEQTSDSDGDNGIRRQDSSNSANDPTSFFDDDYEELSRGKENEQKKKKQGTLQQENNSSSLLARSLMSEVDNPNTMSPHSMAQREKKLLKAQEKARQHNKKYGVGALRTDASNQNGVVRPIGSPSEGVGQPSVMGSIAHALTGNYNDTLGISNGRREGSDPSILPPNSLSEHRAVQIEQRRTARGKGRNSPTSSLGAMGKHTVTLGLSLSRRSSSLGHPDTVTRQTAFDFNELQDREYKYVSSTDSSGWRAGGGERGGESEVFFGEEGNGFAPGNNSSGLKSPGTPNGEHNHKVAAPDTVHIPIIHIDADSPQAVDAIISALARGEIFIPHMAIIPEALSVNGVSPPDLVVRFGTERNEDLPPDEWPNWCLEFMHNQLYEYFSGMGARWMKRPFSITLAKKVRWKTVKHMNRYFSHAERVIDAWREKGPQYLDPQLAYIEGGATPEEVARPHGIYLLRNGVPTNYFAPNFNPPYTTKMTRSLLFNVLGKSWDKKRREWSSMPIPKLITPSMLVSAMCGCTDNQASGFVATEATLVDGPPHRSTTIPEDAAIRSFTPQSKTPRRDVFGPTSPLSSQKKTKSKNRKQDTLNMDNVNNAVPAPIAKNIGEAPESISKNPATETKSEEGSFSPRLELQISSSSASFFDVAASDSNEIPSPPAENISGNQDESDSKKREQQDPEPKAHFTLVQNSRQQLEPREQRQDQQQEQRPENDVEEVNDENSGDSKNHKSNGGGNSLLKKKKKKIQETDSKLASDEEWLNDVGKSSPKTEYKTMVSLQAEQQQHKREVHGNDRFRDGAVGPGSPTVRSNNSSKSSTRVALMNMKSNEMGAALSMEYSVDDSTLVTSDKSVGEYTFDSTLLGQNFAADSKSVISTATKETFVMKDVLEEVPENTQHTIESSIGTHSSCTTTDDEPVPSDEDLFAAGWAKALDSNSGSYYYFTLDRKQTVWDNPLAPPLSPTNSEYSSVVGEI